MIIRMPTTICTPTVMPVRARTGKTEETKALLTYMIHHNEHHAEKLAELMDSLPQEARKKMSIAIGSFEAANVELQAVLDCLS